ncbi:hypothetical protein H0H81_012322 [Sphagnurus paluster]|uniref:Uncharacterized protein n=1 Tax=Sphagnurus paluster TaxID=117069 RepID=A0A9P7GI34_9AGAR|nr:hypothetical protein H0H81_012322 [Sphagnurus paluster]
MSNQQPIPVSASSQINDVPLWPQRKTAREHVEILNKYRKKYKSLTSTAERGDMFRTMILPDIFNHWKAKGITFEEATAQQQIRKLGKYISNNWRAENDFRKKIVLPTTTWNVFRHTWKDDILEELQKMGHNNNSQERFKNFNTATAQVKACLTNEERLELKEATKRWRDFGPPREEQQR